MTETPPNKVTAFLDAFYEIPTEERSSALAALDYLRNREFQTEPRKPESGKPRGRRPGSKNKPKDTPVNGADHAEDATSELA